MTRSRATELLARFDALDGMLVKAGWPKTSPWWRRQIKRFLLSGRRRWVLRVGRRGGKSSTLCRLAYVLARWGKHRIPPGDTGFVMFISKDRDEAAQRLRTITEIAKVVGDHLEPRGDELLLRGRRTGFKVFTATIAGVSGPTAILVVGDEVAKWRDADSGANPATEVIASAMPTIATQPEALAVWSSSPLGLDDAHARMFDEGDTAAQLTAFAPTWVANPTVTEEQTHELEPDPRVHAREYAAIPQAGALGAFDPDAIARAIGRVIDAPVNDSRFFGRPIVVIDASRGRKDSFTWGVARAAVARDGAEFIQICHVDGIPGGFGIHGDAIVDLIAACAKHWRAHEVNGDGFESMGLEAGFRRHGLRFRVRDWTSTSKSAAVEQVRRWLSDDRLALPDHEKLRLELLRFEEKISPSGSLTFSARGSGHDDYVSLLVTLAMAKLPRIGVSAGASVEPTRSYVTDGYGHRREVLTFPGGGSVFVGPSSGDEITVGGGHIGMGGHQ